jgi:7-cyano-7-deazaguanine synthase in queuosine biosynthesis
MVNGTVVSAGVNAGVAGSRRDDTRRTKSLVMWSGGLDSTFALARLLETTADEVYAHHVHCEGRTDDGRRRSRRCEYEAHAVERLREAMAEHYRPFDYGESRIDLSGFSQLAPETTMAAYFAAHVALSSGFTPFDRIVLGASADDVPWQPHTHRYAFRRMVTLRVLRAVSECEEVPFLHLFSPRPSKQAEADALPPGVFARTASCRDPDLVETPLGESRFRPCGVCPQCVVRGRIVHRAMRPDPPAGIAGSGETGSGLGPELQSRAERSRT